jgi:hypothetical protein
MRLGKWRAMESWLTPSAVQQVGLPIVILAALAFGIFKASPWFAAKVDQIANAHTGFIAKLDGILDKQTTLLDKIADRQEEHDRHLRVIRKHIREEGVRHDQKRPPAA